MGKLSEFIEASSEILGISKASVESYVKPLRRAGLLTSGPRGTAAPKTTSRDCATITIAAMLGSPTHALARTAAWGQMLSCLGPDKNKVAAKFDLTPKHTFLDMVTRLFEVASDDTLEDRITRFFIETGLIPRNRRHSDGTEIDFGHYASFDINTSAQVAFIELVCVCNSLHVDTYAIRYLPPYIFEKPSDRRPVEPEPLGLKVGGIYYTAHAGPDVLEKIGSFLRVEQSDSAHDLPSENT